MTIYDFSLAEFEILVRKQKRGPRFRESALKKMVGLADPYLFSPLESEVLSAVHS